MSIFERLARHEHYDLTDEFREGLAEHMRHRVAMKDEHFGNGRMVRNLFEDVIRKMANRIVEAAELTPQLLSTFERSDLDTSSECIAESDSQ